MKKVVAIANQKGGVGKTTTAVNLAACMAIGGHRCLLIDIDPQGNATSGLGAERRVSGGTDAALTAPHKPDTWIEKSKVEGLALVPATEALRSAGLLLRHEVDPHRQLRRAVDHVRDSFDFVFIDCPPSFGLLPLNALVAADEVLVPVQCEYYAMEGLAQMLDTLAAAQAEQGAGVEIGGFVLTMYEDSVPLAKEIATEVRTHFASKTYKSVVPRDAALGEAPSHGLPVIEYAPRSGGANAYIQLTRELIDANR